MQKLFLLFIAFPWFVTAQQNITAVALHAPSIVLTPKEQQLLTKRTNRSFARYQKKEKYRGLEKQVQVSTQIGYFRPSKSLFREIYGSKLVNYRLSLQVQLYKMLFGIVDTNFLHKRGRALGQGEKTEVLLVPVDIGFKLYIPGTKYLSCYLKAAGEITGTFIINNTPLVEDIKQSAAGGVVGVGCLLAFSRRYSVCVDIFADYSFVRLHPFGKVGAEGQKTQIGGFILGAGLGYKF